MLNRISRCESFYLACNLDKCVRWYQTKKRTPSVASETDVSDQKYSLKRDDIEIRILKGVSLFRQSMDGPKQRISFTASPRTLVPQCILLIDWSWLSVPTVFLPCIRLRSTTSFDCGRFELDTACLS